LIKNRGEQMGDYDDIEFGDDWDEYDDDSELYD